jgi:Nuclease-related domain
MASESRTRSVETRRPGQHGREVLRRSSLRRVAALAVLAAPALLAPFVGAPTLGVIGFEIVLIGLMVAIDGKVTARLRQRLRGSRAEEKVGEILDALAAHGWLTVHDVSTGRGNIDHIAIGPGGVLTIETKSHRGRAIPSRIRRRWLAQAYAERRCLEELAGVRADCMLVFSDAYIVGSPVSRRRGVLIVPARMLAGHLMRRRTVLSPAEVTQSYSRIVSALSAV